MWDALGDSKVGNSGAAASLASISRQQVFTRLQPLCARVLQLRNQPLPLHQVRGRCTITGHDVPSHPLIRELLINHRTCLLLHRCYKSLGQRCLIWNQPD
jgi:hypothetical protein